VWFQRVLIPLLACGTIVAQTPAATVDAPKRPWSDKASLSFVSVDGNAKSQSLGFANEYKYAWSDATFAFNAGGVRVGTTTFNRSASGPDLNNVTVVQTETTATTTENYFANLRYDHNITDHLFWFGAAGWDRNVPSGIDSRTIGSAGLGYWWIKEDRTKFRTDLGLGYTKISPVLMTPGFEDSFGTWSFGASFEKKFLAASLFTSNLQVTDSLRNSQDYLGVWQNALTVSMSTHLALQVGYNITYKNRPAFVGVDVLQTPVAAPPVVIGQVPVQLKKTDTVLTTSLVITF
jgi:putative salt-induced outer membrane protein YdiY